MNPQRIKIIKGIRAQEVEEGIDAFCASHNVFATQTHFVIDTDNVMHYAAFLFYREVSP